MTTRYRDHVVSAVATLLGSVLLLILTGAWSSKESVVDHQADMQTIRAWQQRVLDVVCLDHPQARQCTAPGEPR